MKNENKKRAMARKLAVESIVESVWKDVESDNSISGSEKDIFIESLSEALVSETNPLRSLIDSEEEGKLAIYCNDNQWHCCICNGVVFEGRLNCRRCGQELIWPEEK